eukprot:768781-Hanusia_phi.AAC.13
MGGKTRKGVECECVERDEGEDEDAARGSRGAGSYGGEDDLKECSDGGEDDLKEDSDGGEDDLKECSDGGEDDLKEDRLSEVGGERWWSGRMEPYRAWIVT